MEEEKANKIRAQIEYYLSNDNLECDEYFHNLISLNPDGYLELDEILKCNKIKKNGWTKEEIVSSIKDSQLVELNKLNTKIRRKNNLPLPKLNEVLLLEKKRQREKINDSKNKKKNRDIKPIILIFKSDKDTDIKWKDIENKYKSLNPTLSVLYTRFKQNEGHFGVVPMTANFTDNKNEINFIKEFNLNDINFTVALCENEELDKFNKENKSHLDLIVNKERNKKLAKNDNTLLVTPVTLGGKEYNNITIIRDIPRKMFSKVKDDLYILDTDETNYIKDLIKYHPDKAITQKVVEAEFLGIDKINPHNYTKSFYVLDKDKNKGCDFLVNKCCEKIFIEDRKKKK